MQRNNLIQHLRTQITRTNKKKHIISTQVSNSGPHGRNLQDL